MFHVSQLKQYLKPTCAVSATPPSAATFLCYPLQVLQRRSIACGCHQVDQVLVCWSDCDEALDTWEDEITLRRQFPAAAAWGQAAAAWGQAASKGGGNVSSKEDGTCEGA